MGVKRERGVPVKRLGFDIMLDYTGIKPCQLTSKSDISFDRLRKLHRCQTNKYMEGFDVL